MTGKILQLLVIFTGGLVAAAFAQAQIAGGPTVISLVATPASPSPGEEVRVEAKTPLFSSGNARFTWTINGKAQPELSGYGNNSISLTAGEVGTAAVVTATVSDAQYGVQTASLTVRVVNLALMSFADTYTPAWYHGRALPTRKARVRVVALPEVKIGGVYVSPENLSYTWRLNDTRNVRSGIGRNVLEIEMGDFVGSLHVVSVVVEDANKRIKKEGTLFIKTENPAVHVYQYSPLGGIEQRLSSALVPAVKGMLLDFIAEPYHFIASSRSDLAFSWRIGAFVVQGSPENPHLLTIDTNSQNSGFLPITAHVEQIKKPNTQAVKLFNVVMQQ